MRMRLKMQVEKAIGWWRIRDLEVPKNWFKNVPIWAKCVMLIISMNDYQITIKIISSKEKYWHFQMAHQSLGFNNDLKKN